MCEGSAAVREGGEDERGVWREMKKRRERRR